MKRVYLVLVALLFVWGCAQEQSTGPASSQDQARQIVGKEVHAQETPEIAEKGSLMEEKGSMVEEKGSLAEEAVEKGSMMADEVTEATLSVSAEVINLEDSAEVLGVVSDEPLDAVAAELEQKGAALDMEEATEGLFEERVEEVSEEAEEELAEEVEEVLPVDDAALQESKNAVEDAIAESLMDAAVEREVAAVLEEVAVEGEEIAAVGEPVSGMDQVSENNWGFSVYDPQADGFEYYSGDGQLLGKDS